MTNLIGRPGDIPRRSTSKAGSPDSMPALVERARVMDVNIRDYTVNVATEFTFKRKFDIPFMTPYCHANQGEGINFMPEIGSLCWVCTPSEQGRDAFVLGWTMPHEQGTYRAGRELLNPGDLHFSTRDGNFIYVRRGGIVQIGATPVCQRIFLPVRNIIQDFAENYELHTPAGDLTWLVARSDEDGDGHKKTTFTLAAKEYSDDPNKDPVALLKIGSHGDSDGPILTLLTRDKGGGSAQTTLEITKSGEIKWSVKKVSLKIAGDFILDVLGPAGWKINIATLFDLTAGGAASIKAASIALAAGNLQLAMGGAGGTSLSGGPISLGDPTEGPLFQSLRAHPLLMTWITMVTAALNTMGPVAGLSGALPVLPPDILSPKVKL